MKYKVGDSVRVLPRNYKDLMGGIYRNSYTREMQTRIGKTFQIIELRPNGDEDYYRLNDENDHFDTGYVWHEDWLTDSYEFLTCEDFTI
jgi:hypothetical protein